MWVVVVIGFLLVSLIWSLTGRRKGLPPGPTCYPIIGNVGIIKPSEAVQSHRRLRKIYGDIYTVMIFHKSMIFVHGYHNIRNLLLKNGDLLSERPNVYPAEVITKRKGLVWTSGSFWKEQRTFALTAMRKFGFGRRCMETQIIEEVDCLMNEMEKFHSSAFDIQALLNITVSNVICSLLFGKRFDYKDAKFKHFTSLLDELFANVKASSPAFILPWLRHIKMFNLDKTTELANTLFGFITEMVEDCKQNFDEDNINNYIHAYLLEQKRRANELDTTFTDEQLNHSVRDFFDAGTETTSTTLRWALLYLMHHQDWQKRLQDDIDDVIGQGQPKMEHKDKLPRVEAFILEVQRLANLVPLNVPHTSKQDFMYNGYIFPKGAIVFGVLDSVMSDPEIFPEPSNFKPERFLDENGKCCGEPKTKLIPFSIGRRSCLGESLARMELFLFLTRFLQKFEVKPEDPNYLPSLDAILGFTNAPRSFNLKLEKR
ncbi:cytochrome P450 2C25-like isoform X2 [Ostrea edulis]|uniref:cytochrome P450 2C25-like isoform X2 n=1 Tax=Ostrea edulis TaxID=37623 RepID=UPI0024AF4F8D|nr:cytochrome P450 2C25-like isoform X2 [Ostrea edulis]